MTIKCLHTGKPCTNGCTFGSFCAEAVASYIADAKMLRVIFEELEDASYRGYPQSDMQIMQDKLKHHLKKEDPKGA